MTTNEEDSAGQDATDLELELEKDPGEDPLDLLGEDELRAEAKKLRAIATRKTKVEPVVKVEEPVKTVITPTDDFVKKSDLARLAVSEAKVLVSEDVKEHWDDLINIPLSGYDNLDAKSIAANMTERLVIFNARNPKKEEKEDISDLSTTKATGTGSGPSDKKDKPKDPPNYKKPSQPEDWYPKKK